MPRLRRRPLRRFPKSDLGLLYGFAISCALTARDNAVIALGAAGLDERAEELATVGSGASVLTDHRSVALAAGSHKPEPDPRSVEILTAAVADVHMFVSLAHRAVTTAALAIARLGRKSTRTHRSAYDAARATVRAAEALDIALTAALTYASEQKQRLDPAVRLYVTETALDAARRAADAAVVAAGAAGGGGAADAEAERQRAFVAGGSGG